MARKNNDIDATARRWQQLHRDSLGLVAEHRHLLEAREEIKQRKNDILRDLVGLGRSFVSKLGNR
jgi:hypothetical protein